jgi:alpha-ketoglutarate-dependent taurine dioxygenase
MDSQAARSHRSNRPRTSPSRTARRWDRASLSARANQIFVAVPAGLNEELRCALDRLQRQGIDLDTVETEDCLLANFAQLAPEIRRRLDHDAGVVVLRGLDMTSLTNDQVGIVAWSLANHIGRPMRQGLHVDRKLFTVTNMGAANADPTRIGASNQVSRAHSDNGCLEMRPPCYIGLLCVENAADGGESTLISAETIYQTVATERPDLLPMFTQSWHFRPPKLHTWPDGPATIQKPILEIVGEGVHIHYARVMIEPGMALAGTPITEHQRQALDWFDAVLERPELVWTYALRPGDYLFTNNLATLHGRLGFSDDGGRRRVLKRVWMRRRHLGLREDPGLLGLDPIANGSQAR